MFYLTTHSTHFIYGYMASDIWLRTILIVRKETRCCHIGYSYHSLKRKLPHEFQVLKAKHQEEVDQLKKKLKWYAENQELLDKSVRTIQEKDKTMLQLKARVEELQTEVSQWSHPLTLTLINNTVE